MNEIQIIQSKIYEIREQQVMLDYDLAERYEVETRVLNQAVKRNIKRFPPDFMFQLTIAEWENLKSQTVTSSWGGSRKRPFVFTEQGLAMLSGVLNSDRAIQVNISIMRAFIAMRQYITAHTPTNELEELRQQIKFLQEDVESLNKDQEHHYKEFDDIYIALAEMAAKTHRNKQRRPIGFIKDRNDIHLKE